MYAQRAELTLLLFSGEWDCLARWNLFASPVRHIASLAGEDAPASLRNCLVCISANSPVAIVSLAPPRHVFTLPGTVSGVDLFATSQDEVLVLYRQGLARICDIATRELRRSMDRRTAENVISEGAWKIW